MQRDWADICGGLAVAAIGAGAAGWAAVHYDMGALRRMGPGAFPVVLGSTLFLLGLFVALPAFARTDTAPKFEAKAALGVLGAILIFALGLPWLGLAGATATAVLVATLPAPRQGWVWRIVLAVAVTALTLLVFNLGLRMTLPVWPRMP